MILFFIFVGSCSVASMNCNRNCLALECDPLLFIQSKVRLTSSSKSSNMEAEIAQGEAEIAQGEAEIAQGEAEIEDQQP